MSLFGSYYFVTYSPINPNGGNTIYGNYLGDTIHGASTGTISSGYIAGNTIYGEGGSNTIYGDSDYLVGTAVAGANIIWANPHDSNDYATANNVIYGNAEYMGGSAQASGNTIHDAYGASSTLYGNAFYMWGEASAGHNIITTAASTNTIYGEAYMIAGETGSGVFGGHNTLYLYSNNIGGGGGIAYGDAELIGNQNQGGGYFHGGWNVIDDFSGSNSTLYGTASVMYTDPVLNGPAIYAGHNSIYGIGGNHTIYGDCYENCAIAYGGYNTIYGDGTIYGDCYENEGGFIGGYNTIHAGAGNDTIYGDMKYDSASAIGGHNTIYAGAGNDTIFGECGQSASNGFTGGYNTIYAGSGNDTIIGDCSFNTSNYSGGHNIIYAGSGNHTIYGDCVQHYISTWQGGFDTYVFSPGTGQVTIEDFDHHALSAFSHAQGDVIDVSAYHLNPTFGVGGVYVTTDPNNSNNALIILPPTLNHISEITLVGVHAQDLTLSDFHF